MSLLTLDVGGANEMEVRCQRVGHAPPREVGERRYTALGRERSMIKEELQVVPVVLWRLSPADAATVRALYANGAHVVHNGVVFNNGLADIVCSGEITDEARPGLLMSGRPWTISITLSQVRSASTVLWVTP